VLLHSEVRVPDPNETWGDTTMADWETYWRSDVAKLATPESMPSLYRLFDDYDERRTLFIGIRKSGARLVGTRDRPRANELYRVIAGLDAEIRQLEDRFGLSPLAKLQLGVAFGDAARSLERMNADFNREYEAAEPEADPRVVRKRKRS
jgi:hypothetical protein